MVPEMWNKPVGKCFALCGSVGQREIAHSLHALERSREVWTARCALLLPFEERADGPQRVGRIRALCLSRNCESMCLDWSAHDG